VTPSCNGDSVTGRQPQCVTCRSLDASERAPQADVGGGASAFLPGQHRPTSGFLLNFTALADCAIDGFLPYGQQSFPPVSIVGTYHNFVFLPFPLNVPACQQTAYSGPQLTRDRPYTVAEGLLKRQVGCNGCNGCNGSLSPWL
jgi:hypothetical protein